MRTANEVISICEKLWSDKVRIKWEAPEGLFTKSANEISKAIIKGHKDLVSAMGSINFYINRAGHNLSRERKNTLEKVKTLLRKSYGTA